MAPSIREKFKGNLEIWAIVLSLISLVGSPAAGYVGFKVAVEADQAAKTAALADHEERIRALELERISIARALGRLEEQAAQTQRTLERIETTIGRAR